MNVKVSLVVFIALLVALGSGLAAWIIGSYGFEQVVFVYHHGKDFATTWKAVSVCLWGGFSIAVAAILAVFASWIFLRLLMKAGLGDLVRSWQRARRRRIQEKRVLHFPDTHGPKLTR